MADHDVAEHDQSETVHILMHVPEHAPREDDPHYHLFEQAKARLKRQGLWKCVINDDLCGGQLELHHTHVEHSQINATDPEKISKALGLHFENDEDFQRWAESPGTSRFCARTTTAPTTACTCCPPRCGRRTGGAGPAARRRPSSFRRGR